MQPLARLPTSIYRSSYINVRRLRWSSSSALKPADEHLPAKPIHFDLAAKIEGEESHIATVRLRPGEVLRAESGAMVYMTEGVTMDTSLSGASSAFQRFLTGQNLFITDYRYEGDTSGIVCLGTDFPSKIMKFDLSEMPEQALVCQRGAFLAANGPHNVNVTTEFTKSLTAGFFGGQGFILQRLSGDGEVLVKGGGTIVLRELEEGETIRVTSGSIVAFEPTLSYDVQMMPGVKNAMFGGEGLFITTLTGPGRIWLQGMPPDRMISEIARRIPGPGLGFGIPLGVGMGGGSTEDATTSGTGEAGAEDLTDTAAASDAAIEADRQATVASSGAMMDGTVDADSPAALFGDAAGDDQVASSFDNSEDSFADPPFYDIDQSQNDGFSETTFTDGLSSDFPSDDVPDGELFDDTSISSESPASVGGEESGGGLFSTLWSIFVGNDDD